MIIVRYRVVDNTLLLPCAFGISLKRQVEVATRTINNITCLKGAVGGIEGLCQYRRTAHTTLIDIYRDGLILIAIPVPWICHEGGRFQVGDI